MTEQTMLERCARAILALHDWTANDGAEGGWGSLSEDWREVYRKSARAVIEELMKPDRAIKDAVYGLQGGHYIVGDLEPIWHAALQSILNQDKQGEGK